jgi:hypothetical protein
MLVGYV